MGMNVVCKTCFNKIPLTDWNDLGDIIDSNKLPIHVFFNRIVSCCDKPNYITIADEDLNKALGWDKTISVTKG